MKRQSILLGTCILAMLVCISLVSAATTFSVSSTALTFDPETSSNSITITNLTSSLSVSLVLPTIDGNTFQYSGNLTDITSSVITITPTSAIDFSEMNPEESFEGYLIITDTAAPSQTENITITITKPEFCDFGNEGDLKVSIESITNYGIGYDEEWYPLDEIEVEIEVENKGGNDIADIVMEWALFDKDNEPITEFIEIDTTDLDEDDDAETFTFTIDLDDDLEIDLDQLDDASYELHVRATGEEDRSTPRTSCEYDKEKIDIIVEKHYVMLNNLKFVGTSYCGGTMQLTADVWNLGEKDEDNVYVMITNSELGIEERADIGDINSFKDKNLRFEFMIPTDAEEKQHTITLEVYDEDGDLYESLDEAIFDIDLDVSGNCEVIPEAVVYASLESGGKSGSEMKILATVTNTGDNAGSFSISASDYSNWAELVSITPSIVTLNSNEAKDVIITLNVDGDVSDEQTFNIVLDKDGGDSFSQPISVTIEKGFSFSNMFGDNGYIWAIALINIVLVAVIIIVAIKASRR